MIHVTKPMESFAEKMKGLERLVSAQEPAGLPKYIATAHLNKPYLTGTLTPMLGVIEAAGTTNAGVVVPKVDPSREPMKYFSGFLGLDEYVGKVAIDQGGEYDNDHWINLLISQHPREVLIVELAWLNSAIRQPDLAARIQGQFRGILLDSLRDYFDQAMGQHDLARVFLARQPVLRAIRQVLLYAGHTKEEPAFPPWVTAIMLAHAFASGLGHWKAGERDFLETGPDLWPGMKASMAVELVQNFLFNQQEDVLARLDRYSRLWDYYGQNLKRSRPRASPNELVKEATGVDRLDLFAVVYSLLARALNWKPGENFKVPDPYQGIGMERALFDTALGVVTTDEATLQEELAGAPDDWQMLPFEQHPVLRIGESVVVLDQGYLIDKATSGLYWIVLDHEEKVYGKKAKETIVWSQAYSEMVEVLAEDTLRAMRLRLLPDGGKTFYTEEDLSAAYGKGVRLCDAVMYFGRGMALFEIQKGQVSLDTRQRGLVEKFKSDTGRMVLTKAKQLQGTADAIFADESALTGYPPTNGLRIFPVAVMGGTYPVNPVTDEYIRIELKELSLLDGLNAGGLEPLAVVDIGELEMLEGLVEKRGIGVLDTLEDWKKGAVSRWSLRNYLIDQYGTSWDQFRPSRMGSSFNALTESVIPRLKVRSESKTADGL
jgi:hypothetical protein